jgi:hypothetical protein
VKFVEYNNSNGSSRRNIKNMVVLLMVAVASKLQCGDTGVCTTEYHGTTEYQSYLFLI